MTVLLRLLVVVDEEEDTAVEGVGLGAVRRLVPPSMLEARSCTVAQKK
jgi:hypothetical protein